VLANRRLRQRLTEEAERRGVGLFVPEPALCTDNGAMIASVAASKIQDGVLGDNLMGDVAPGLRLDS
jgi:N6-L-threonylcarbamoyladenine synthase